MISENIFALIKHDFLIREELMKVLGYLTDSLNSSNNRAIINNLQAPRLTFAKINNQADAVIINHPNYQNSDHIIKKINASDDQQVHFIFSKLDSKITVNLVNKDSLSTTIKPENLPQELLHLKTGKLFTAYLEHAYVKVSILSDLDPKVYLRQKLCGGGQNEQNAIINEFTGKCALNEINVGLLLTAIRNRLNEEPTINSKQTIKNLYVNWFVGTYGSNLNYANVEVALSRCQSIFNEPLSEEPAKYTLQNGYDAWFRSNYGMDSSNINILAQHKTTLFKVVTPPIVQPIITPVINHIPIKINPTPSEIQAKQSALITEYLQAYGTNLDEGNTSILLQNVLGGEATALSKQLIKEKYINYYIGFCGTNLNETNTAIGIKRTIDLFQENLGKEPARTLLKSAYVKWFTRDNSGYQMNETNIAIGIQGCTDLFQVPLGNEPAKYLLKYAYLAWFTRYDCGYAMNEDNTLMAMSVASKLFNDVLGKEPAKLLLQEKYIEWFKVNYDFNLENQQVLAERYKSLFGETFVNASPNLLNGESYSHDSDLIGYGEEVLKGLGVAAGDPYKYVDKNDSKTIGLISDIWNDLVIDGCVNNLKNPTLPSVGASTTMVVLYSAIERWTKLPLSKSIFKHINGEIIGLCVYGIWEKIDINLKNCKSIICKTSPSSSNNSSSSNYGGGSHKETTSLNNNTTYTGTVTIRAMTDPKDSW